MDIALQQYGVRETPGGSSNPQVIKYFNETGFSYIKGDETGWCSAFMNWCADKAGMESSGKLDARSWMKVGRAVAKPKLGDVVVFWREDPISWKGHVGLFLSQTNKYIYVLGGNQSDMVCVKPYLRTQALGFYRPVRKKDEFFCQETDGEEINGNEQGNGQPEQDVQIAKALLSQHVESDEEKQMEGQY